MPVPENAMLVFGALVELLLTVTLTLLLPMLSGENVKVKLRVAPGGISKAFWGRPDKENRVMLEPFNCMLLTVRFTVPTFLKTIVTAEDLPIVTSPNDWETEGDV